MSFIDWIPILVKHRPYEVQSNIQRVGGCHGCKKCVQVGKLHDYPNISDSRVRTVCDSCLIIDKKDGTFDAIMDIWNNYEEHQGIGHKRTIKEILERADSK